jgi:hypothetical protein
MDKYSRTSKIIGIILSVIILSGTVLVTAQNQYYTNLAQSTPPILPTIIYTPSPTRPSYCVPIPQEIKTDATLTATPDRIISPIPYSRPSVTPRVFGQVIDLSPELPYQEKTEVIIFRCSGVFDKYYAGPEMDILQAINLEPGDLLVNSIPPVSMMGHQPSEPSSWNEITPSTSIPYPPPTAPSFETATQISYPAPVTSTPENVEP